jgi:hypothetical protein
MSALLPPHGSKSKVIISLNILPTSTITAQSSFPELERIEQHGHGDKAMQDE